MKKIFLASLFLLVAGLASCSKDQGVAPEPGIYPEDGLVTLTRTFGVETRSGQPATLTAVFNVKTEKIVECTASQSLLDVVQMTPAEFDGYLQQKLGPSWQDLSGNFVSTNPKYDLIEDLAYTEPLTTCLAGCDNKKKGEGRGWCRFGCVWDALWEVIKRLF